MLRNWRRPAQLFSDFNTLQFASVMGLILLLPVLIFMADTRPHDIRRISVDLPKVAHPISMPGVDREDAITVAVTRDGRVYFGTDQVPNIAMLDQMIARRLQDHSVERKVYVVADMRARWGGVKQVLDSVHRAGILRVAFLVDQRHVSVF